MATITKKDIGPLVAFDEGEVAQFSWPDVTVIGLGLSGLSKDPFALIDSIVDNCYLEGTVAKDTIMAEVRYLIQMEGVADDVCGKVTCSIEKIEDGFLVKWAGACTLQLRRLTRQVYTTSRIKSQQNSLNGLRHILRGSAKPGQEKTLDSVCDKVGFLLGFSEVMDRYIGETAERLGN